MKNLTIISSSPHTNSGKLSGAVSVRSEKGFAFGKIAFVALFVVSLFAATNSYSQVTVTGGGATGTYTSLTGASGLFVYLNTHTITGNVTATITANINEPGTTTLTTWTESGVGGYSLTIQSDGLANHILYGTPATNNAALIPVSFSAVQRVIIISGGSGNNLTFINTNATPANTGPVLSFGASAAGKGLASGSSISNVNVQSNATTAADGAIVIGGTGTNIVSISNCNISDAPSVNLSGNSGPLATGIYTSNANNVLTISGNSFYEVNTLGAALSQVAIDLVSVGSGNSVTGNYIGGSAALCTGTWTNSSTGTFTGIYMSAAVATASAIGGNIIGNLSFTGTLATGFLGINVAAGYVNIGGSSLLANTIGASAYPIVASSTTTGPITGISLISASTTGCQVSNNTISYISSAGPTTIYGISIGTVSLTSPTLIQTNTIQNIAQTYSGATATNVYGIYSVSGGVLTIGGASSGLGNNINTISCSGTGINKVVGIYVNYSISNAVGYTVSYNTIGNGVAGNISAASTGAGSIVGGIYLTNITSSLTAISNFNNNTISGFTASGAAVTFYGIYLSMNTQVSAGSSNVQSNAVNTILMSGTGASVFNGIAVASGWFQIGGSSSTLGNTIGSKSSLTSIQNMGTGGAIYGLSVTTGSGYYPGVVYTSINFNTIAGFTNSSSSSFIGILLGANSNNSNYLVISEILNNTIQYLSFTAFGAGTFTGISVPTGRVNVGIGANGSTVGGNTIGDPLWATDGNAYPIVVSGGATTSGTLTGISMTTSASQPCLVENNIIASISSTYSAGTNTNSFRGITLNSGSQNSTFDLEGNTIENIMLANNSASSGPTLYGIYGGNNNGNYNIGDIAGNTITNLTNKSLAYTASTVGIFMNLTTANSYNITKNTISNITAPVSNGGYVAGIYFSNTSATSVTIDENTISGFNLSGSTGILYGIYLSVMACPANVQGNTVEGITMTGTSTSFFYGIDAVANQANAIGPINIGTTTGNTIGGTGVNAISLAGANGNTNNVGTGIYISGSGPVNIGSYTSTATGVISPVGSVVPIGNNIYGITSTQAAYNPQEGLTGIQSACTGAVTIAGNSIHNLSNAVTEEGGYVVPDPMAVSGILLTGAATGTTVTQNVIYTLIATATGAYTNQVGGILVYAGASPVISQNRIYDLENLSASTTSPYPMVVGIYLYNPTATVQVSNNMISLGNTYIGPSTNTLIYGIECGITGTYTLDAWFNSVNIEGTAASSGGANSYSYAFYRGSTSTVTIGSLKNNIFNNGRLRGTSGAGIGYAIYNAVTSPGPTTGWATGVSNYNDLYVAGTGNVLGYWGSTAKTTLALWTAAGGTGYADAQSQNVLPGFTIGSSSAIGTAIGDLRIAPPGNCSLYRDGTYSGVTPTVDYYNTNRNSSAPDIGAYEFMDSFLVSAPTTCLGFGAVVTVTSSSLISGTYTVTYNMSGGSNTNTISSTTAPMTFTAGSPGTGTFTTAVLPNAGTNNIVTVTGIALSTGVACASESTPAFTTNICPNIWMGTTSSTWTDITNWSLGVAPNGCSTIVNIPAGTPHPPVISGSDASVGSVIIASGATLTLSGNNLNVCGSWTGGSGSNATIAGSGVVYLNSGTGAQTISGNTQFTVLQVNNTSGVTLGSGATVAIVSGLQLQAGNLNISAGTLHLLSTASNNNSYIDDFTGTGTLTGSTVTADRYVPVIGFNQHFISSPVSTPSFSQLGASGPDGSYVIPFDCDEWQSAYNSPYGRVFQYNDGHMPSGGCMLGNWEIRSQGNLVNGLGYSTYLTGNSTLSLTGAANTGDISVANLNNSGYPTVYTTEGHPIESGWNLVGNPYPSAITLTASRDGAGFQNQVQVWVSSGPFEGSWQYAVIDSSPSSALTIAPFQAFMVRVKPGSTGIHSYPFYQSERVRNTNTSFYRTQADNTLELDLGYNGMKDVTTVTFKPEATNAFDDAYDANKPDGGQGRPTLYTTMNDNHWYALNCVPPLKQVATIPVGLHPEATGTMTVTPVGIESFDPTTYIWLEDKQTNTMQDLRSGAYTFNTNINDAQDRFILHFTPPAEIMTSDASCSSSGIISITQPGTASWTYTVTDNNNVTISGGTLNQNNPVIINANAGIYILTLTDNNGYVVVKNIQVVGSQPVVASFGTSISTAQVQTSIVFTGSTDNASTYTWDFGDGSTASGKTTSHNYQVEGTYTVTLTVTGSTGCSSSTTQTITVTPRSTTGISSLTGDSKINIWSNENRVYVDFTKQASVDADIEIYNVLGQVLSSEKFGKSGIYSKEIDNLEAAYLIIRVNNDAEVTTKKVFIANIK